VLIRLAKGHTGADVSSALDILAAAGIAVQGTLVAFTPWTTLDDYLFLSDFIRARGLEENFRPVQMSVRLLVPPHSVLAEAPDAAAWLGPLEAANFGYSWRHADRRMDELHAAVSALVAGAEARGEPARVTHAQIAALAYAAAGREPPASRSEDFPGGAIMPRLTEDWFCCAEPTPSQSQLIQL
jgi:hypothetical protein